MLFQGLSSIVDRQSRIIGGRELEEAVTHHLRTNGGEESWNTVLAFNDLLEIRQQRFLGALHSIMNRDFLNS